MEWGTDASSLTVCDADVEEKMGKSLPVNTTTIRNWYSTRSIFSSVCLDAKHLPTHSAKQHKRESLPTQS